MDVDKIKDALSNLGFDNVDGYVHNYNLQDGTHHQEYVFLAKANDRPIIFKLHYSQDGDLDYYDVEMLKEI